MKIALVYDRINKFGGAERILLALHRLWPQAPIYTAVYNPATTPWADNINIIPSFLNYFPLAKTHHELYPLLTPLAFESFNLSSYDVVISITSAEAKAVITLPHTLHLCYCLTPTRYLWSHASQYLKKPGLGSFNRIGKQVFKLTQKYQQKTDLILSCRPDKYIAISQTVSRRIKRYYHQAAPVIYPPIDYQKFLKPQPRLQQPNKPYFLLVSRLTPYKKVDLAIKVFNRFKKPLVIIGQGRELPVLQKLAGPFIHFIHQPTDNQLISYYQHAKALIMPQIEDLGLVALEAQAAGTPVIAFSKGGALETVVPKRTGLLFNAQTVDSLTQAVKQFNTLTWDKSLIQAQAGKFAYQPFKQQLLKVIKIEWTKLNTR